VRDPERREPERFSCGGDDFEGERKLIAASKGRERMRDPERREPERFSLRRFASARI
jgi:hypothetical protein